MENIKNLEKILKALANQRRLKIIKTLSKERELNVDQISEAIRLSFKATSKHLGILRQLDILDRKQVNLNMYYRISNNLPTIVKRLFDIISNSYE
jgi:DNA-binding transcriptional ArsR family regulator